MVWICLYFIVDRVVIGHPLKQSAEDLEAQIQDARRIFSGSFTDRLWLFTTLNTQACPEIDRILRRLHPAAQTIGWEIKKMMELLVEAYDRAEQGDIENIAHSRIALSFRHNITRHLARIVAILEEQDLECAPLPVAEVMAEHDGEDVNSDGDVEREPIEGTEAMVQSQEESSWPSAKRFKTGDP